MSKEQEKNQADLEIEALADQKIAQCQRNVTIRDTEGRKVSPADLLA